MDAVENMELLKTYCGKYIEYGLGFSNEEIKIIALLSEWLPNEIIDCHAHANSYLSVQALSKETLNRVHSTFPFYSIEDSQIVKKATYPNLKVRTLRFSNPYKGINHKLANTYLLENSPSDDRVALCGIPDDTKYTIEQLRSKRFVGLKMYNAFFEPPTQKITDFFPYSILSVAEEEKIPIILHTPFIISECYEELLTIVNDFPSLTIVIAHMGRERTITAKTEKAFSILADYKQVYFDTSTIFNLEVLVCALKKLGPDRIMYGSDEPFNLLRYIILNNRFISNYPYHWLDKTLFTNYREKARDAFTIHTQELQALKWALEEYVSNQEELNNVKKRVFYKNAAKVFSF